jgi:hypothetical protein
VSGENRNLLLATFYAQRLVLHIVRKHPGVLKGVAKTNDTEERTRALTASCERCRKWAPASLGGEL